MKIVDECNNETNAIYIHRHRNRIAGFHIQAHVFSISLAIPISNWISLTKIY